MYAEIVPIVRLIRKLKYFDYKIPSELEGQIKIGQIVEIEFRKKKINGVVQKIKKQTKTPQSKIKEIIKVLPIPTLTEKQLKLVNWMSDFYLLSPALIFKTTLPQIPKRLKELDIQKIKINSKIKQDKEADKILKSKNKNFLLHYLLEERKNQVYLSLIQNYLKKDKQTIIAVPELIDIKKLTELLEKHFDKDLIVGLHSGLSKGKFFKSWLKIRNNQAKIIIGTRYAVFAPASNLGLIIIDKEHNDSHKQWDQNPRYHDRDIALKLSELTKCKILLSSSSPSIEVYYENFKLIDLDQKTKLCPIKIVDMRDELRKGNYSVFSETLQDAITKTFQEGKKIFLLINKRGAARAVICRDCGHIAKCSNCDIPLTYHTDYSLICHNCNHQERMKVKCPNCQGVRFKYVGSGTQKIEAELKKLTPDAKTIRIDSDADISKDIEQKIYSGDFQVIVGTKLALKYLDLSKLGFAGIISADVLLGIPDFRSLEKTYQLINGLHINLSEKAELIVQTRNPENYAIKAAKNNDYEKFYSQEIEQRKALTYPPFSQLVKLSFRDLNQKKSLETAKSLLKLLERNQKEKLEDITISGPFTKRAGKFYISFIILKIPIKLFKESYEILNLVPDIWTIDINPESLL